MTQSSGSISLKTHIPGKFRKFSHRDNKMNQDLQLLAFLPPCCRTIGPSLSAPSRHRDITFRKCCINPGKKKIQIPLPILLYVCSIFYSYQWVFTTNSNEKLVWEEISSLFTTLDRWQLIWESKFFQSKRSETIWSLYSFFSSKQLLRHIMATFLWVNAFICTFHQKKKSFKERHFYL